MTRRKHGQYNALRKLPNNEGIPAGSGLYVWLYEEVRSVLKDGHALVQEASAQGSRKAAFLLARLRHEVAREPLAVEILREFAERKKRYEAARRQWQRLQHIAALHQQRRSRPNDSFLARQIQRLEREVEKAQQRWYFTSGEIDEIALLRERAEGEYTGNKNAPGEDDGKYEH